MRRQPLPLTTSAMHLKMGLFSAALISLSYLSASAVTQATNSARGFMPLDLTSLFNNKAFGRVAGEAAFDALGQSYLDPKFDSPRYTSSDTGVDFTLPGYTGPGKPDNLICEGQKIAIPNGTTTSAASSPFSVSFLVAGDLELASVSKSVTFTYTDGSISLYELRSLSWFNTLTINRGEIVFPGRFATDGKVNFNTTHIFERTASLSAGKQLSSITLPTTTNTRESRLHVFAITLFEGSGLEIQSVRPTQKWIGNGTQIVEVTVNNAGKECVAGKGLNVTIQGEGFRTAKQGYIKRLCPGDQKVVAVGVDGVTAGVAHASAGGTVVSLISDNGKTIQSETFPGLEIGLRDWTPDTSSLSTHETPDWFNVAKYGIFIHWGPYAVTGWGNSTPYESYAEWFWWYSTNHPQGDRRSNFYGYRRDTFGESWAYDDTFPQFTASKYDPKEWVNLFADAGAKYFVITSKHHDGFAIFDTGATSNRSSLHYGPKRDLLRELFDAAEKHHPDMKRGTYFSLPEWFNPSFAPYGFDQFNKTLVPSTVSWPGGLARNPYTNATEPYTGHVPVADFVADLMVPQMDILAHNYSTDIMWCDCGTANGTNAFASKWWNAARSQNRQVAINSRCGTAQIADFDTPEYQTFSSAQRHKWESNRGMDPYSYGYNRATKDGEYMNASTIVKTLVDIVSKNGNFLLDVGPKADGTIVPKVAENLREAGKWIKRHGEAIYNTTTWFVQSQLVGGDEGEEVLDVRFTQNDGAFFMLFLERPKIVNGKVEIPVPMPVLEGDEVSLLGVDGGEELKFEVKGGAGAGAGGKGGAKALSVEVAEDLLAREEFCWVFRVLYVS